VFTITARSRLQLKCHVFLSNKQLFPCSYLLLWKTPRELNQLSKYVAQFQTLSPIVGSRRDIQSSEVLWC
jgi:hypothetical protein